MVQGKEDANERSHTFSWEELTAEAVKIGSCKSWRLTKVSIVVARLAGVSRTVPGG
jgi:hypothetical protein